MSLQITHRIGDVTSGRCPDCGESIRTISTVQLVDASKLIRCTTFSEEEMLRIKLEEAEDRVVELKRSLERLQRQKVAQSS